MKDTNLLVVGMALISTLMLMTGTITVTPIAIAVRGEGTYVGQSIGRLLPIGVISDVNHTILAQ